VLKDIRAIHQQGKGIICDLERQKSKINHLSGKAKGKG
jgi:hypothetical protein